MKKYLIIFGVFISAVVLGFGTLRTLQVDVLKKNDVSVAAINVQNAVSMDSQLHIAFEEDVANGNNFVSLAAPSALSGDVVLNLPAAYGENGNVLKTDGAGNMIWGEDAGGSTTTNESKLLENASIATSVGSSALTIALKTEDGGDPAAGDKVRVGFRSATATSGDYDVVEVTSSLSLTISSGSTLGQASNGADEIFVYLVNNAGTVLLAASGALLDEGSLHTTTAEGGAGGADSATALYASSGVSDKAIRLLGRIKNTQTTAGTWASAGDELSVVPFKEGNVSTQASYGYRVESAKFAGAAATTSCSSSPCTVYDETGDWISSVTRNSTGNYTVNINAGTFSATPTCMTTSNSTTSSISILVNVPASATSVTAVAYSDLGAAQDDAVQIFCMGPR